MAVYRTAPTYDQPLTQGSNTHVSWYRFFQSLDSGTPPSNETAVIPTGSPYTYSATCKGFLIITGAVTSIMVSRTPGVFYSLGTQVNGAVPVSQNDQVKIVYTAIPNLVWVPQ